MIPKRCSKCFKTKDGEKDFYLCSGRYRGECKACTIKRNVRYQKKNRSWKFRYQDDEARREYMREYYSKNKERYARYRAEFRARYPEYYKEYFRKRKEK